MAKYNKLKNMGYGCYGHVSEGYNEANEPVVYKEYHISDLSLKGVPSSVIREISLLREMEHSNIVRLLGVVNNREHGEYKVRLVFEYMKLDLGDFIKTHSETAKNPRVIKTFLYQILSGLAYCHSHKILHRDLNPESLLIDPTKYILKLADFGSARAVGVPGNTYTQGKKVEATLWYKAPELLLESQKYSFPADVWSVGCIFAEMWNHKPLFKGSHENEVQVNIFRILGAPNEETFPGAGTTSLCNYLDIPVEKNTKKLAKAVPNLEPAGFDLLSKMLCVDPNERITACNALKHPYFNSNDVETH